MSQMYPHTLTLIRKSDYSVSIVNGVYWVDNRSKSLGNKQLDSGSSVTVYLPLNKDVFSLGDMLIKGEHELTTVTSVADLEDYDYVTVSSKSTYDVGSELDNVILQCL